MSTTKKCVFFDHDGSIDDLLALLLLLRLPNIEVIGISITPGDSYPADALLLTQKILNLTGKSHIPVCVGTAYGENCFPTEWRAQPKICLGLPQILRQTEEGVTVIDEEASAWMQKVITNNPTKVTIAMTGPATNLANALSETSNDVSSINSLKNNIDQVIWMGGAIDVEGNVVTYDNDGSSEWNYYWDSRAAKTLLESGINLLMVPLDAVSNLPISWPFLNKLANMKTEVSELASSFWAGTIVNIPAYEFNYLLWDISAVSVLGLPKDKYKISRGKISVSTKVPNTGETFRDEKGGKTVAWVSSFDEEYIREFIIKNLTGKFQ